MNERLKQLRKSLSLTQEEFAKRLGIKRNTLANYEIGRNEPIDAVMSLICREFKVNEQWLRMGKGEIFITTPDDEIEVLAAKYNLSDLAKRVVSEFVKLDKNQSDAVLGWLKNVFANTEVVNEDSSAYNGEKEEIFLAAAHNDNLKDPEEQEKVRRDFDKI